VVDVTPRAVGSEHFVTTDFNPLREEKKTKSLVRRSTNQHKKRQLKENK